MGEVCNGRFHDGFEASLRRISNPPFREGLIPDIIQGIMKEVFF